MQVAVPTLLGLGGKDPWKQQGRQETQRAQRQVLFPCPTSLVADCLKGRRHTGMAEGRPEGWGPSACATWIPLGKPSQPLPTAQAWPSERHPTSRYCLQQMNLLQRPRVTLASQGSLEEEEACCPSLYLLPLQAPSDKQGASADLHRSYHVLQSHWGLEMPGQSHGPSTEDLRRPRPASDVGTTLASMGLPPECGLGCGPS